MPELGTGIIKYRIAGSPLLKTMYYFNAGKCMRFYGVINKCNMTEYIDIALSDLVLRKTDRRQTKYKFALIVHFETKLFFTFDFDLYMPKVNKTRSLKAMSIYSVI